MNDEIDTGLLSVEEYEHANSMQYITKFRQTLNNIKRNKFSVGDYLNCWNKKKNRYEPMSGQVKTIPAVYKVMHINDIGLVFVKKICIKGTISERTECITFVDVDRFEYRLDKGYADFLMLAEEGEEFNPFDYVNKLIERRKEVNLFNKKSRAPTRSIEQVYEWLSQLKPGDKIWLAPNYYNEQPSSNEYTVTKIEEGRRDDFELTITLKNTRNKGRSMDAYNFWGTEVWLTKPMDY